VWGTWAPHGATGGNHPLTGSGGSCERSLGSALGQQSSGSTITQQLVKDVYLGGSDSGLNKLADMALALKVELRTSKPQILADYLSVVLTGYGRYGMANAACADFHRPLAELDLGQLALLAGLPQAPPPTIRCSIRRRPSAAASRARDPVVSVLPDHLACRVSIRTSDEVSNLTAW